MLGLECKILSLLFSCIFLLQALAVRFVVGTFLFPAALFSLCWFCFTLVPLLAVPSAPFNPLAILYMSAGTFAFMLAALPFDWKRAFDKNRGKAPAFCRSFDSRFIHYCLAASILFSLVFSTLAMIGNGVDWRSLLFDMLETSRIYAARRGHEDLGYGIVGMLGVLFTYIAPVFGGFLFQAKKAPGKRLIVFFASLAPALYVMLAQSTKLTLLNALAFFTAAVLLVKIVSGDLAFFRFSHLAKAAAVLLLVTPLVLMSFLSRAGYTELHKPIRAVRSLDFTLKSYTVGEIYAFSDFFSQRIGMPSEFHYPNDGYSLGNYSFKFVFDTLCISKRFPPGFYREAYRSGNAFSTNIFTVFRGLIHDFGVFGSILCLFVLGLFFHAAYYRILVGANPYIPCAIFVVMVDFIVLSYLFSIFNSRYSLLLAATLAVVLFVNGTIASKPEARSIARGPVRQGVAMNALLVSLKFNPGHFSHLAANYRLFQDSGFTPFLYVHRAFNAMDERDEFRKVNCPRELRKIGSIGVAVFWFPSLRNIVEIIRLRLFRGARIIYVFHEPFDSLANYRRAGFGLRQLVRICLIDMVNVWVVRFSHRVVLPSRLALAVYQQRYAAINPNGSLIPLLFDDEAQGVSEATPKEFISYIGTLGANHAFEQFVAFVAAAIANGWFPGLRFLIATRSEIPEKIRNTLQPHVQAGKLLVAAGKPMSSREINGHFQGSLVVWNAYSRFMQSGVLPKAYMFGAAVLASAQNANEFVTDRQTGILIRDNRDVHEIKLAVEAILADRTSYFRNCRKMFLSTFFYKSKMDEFSRLMDDPHRTLRKPLTP